MGVIHIVRILRCRLSKASVDAHVKSIHIRLYQGGVLVGSTFKVLGRDIGQGSLHESGGTAFSTSCTSSCKSTSNYRALLRTTGAVGARREIRILLGECCNSGLLGRVRNGNIRLFVCLHIQTVPLVSK